MSFLKAPVAQQGHPTSSSPLDEQKYLVNTINHLEKLPSWKSTAVIITESLQPGACELHPPTSERDNPERRRGPCPRRRSV